MCWKVSMCSFCPPNGSHAHRHAANRTHVNGCTSMRRFQARSLRLGVIGVKKVHEPMEKWPEQHAGHCQKEKTCEQRVTRCE